MTPEKPDLDALARLLSAATKGPWDVTDYEDGLVSVDAEHNVGDCVIMSMHNVAGSAPGPEQIGVNVANAEAIAALRNAAEWLIQRARHADDAEKYKAHIRTCGECIDCYVESQPHPVVARDQLVGDLDDLREWRAKAERYEKALRDIAGFELRGPAWEQLARDVVDDARAALKGETL